MHPITDTLCPGCFAETGHTNPCPHCGYDETAQRATFLLPHRTLLAGQFLVGRVLGKPGGFGVTYLGWDLSLATRVAIKEYLPRDLVGRATDCTTIAPHAGDEDAQFRVGLEQFLREARTLAQIEHPNIVRVRHFFETNGTAYLVMDYYRGLSLAEFLERQGGRLPEEQARAILLPILDGLRAVHAKGFLHRDIKPQNIYLAGTESGGARPVLLDFGAARQAAGEHSRSLSVMLTPGYAPFEQYHRKGRQGPWTDIYGAAAVLYHLVTGEAPPEATERRDGTPLRPAVDFGVSRALSDLLTQALSMAPELRPESVQAFQARLALSANREPPATRNPVAATGGAVSALGQTMAPSQASGQTSVRRSGAGHQPAEIPWRRRPVVLAGGVTLLVLCGWFIGHTVQHNALQRQRHEADERAFALAKGADTAAAYSAYLETCAAGGCGHRFEAEDRLADLTTEAARATAAAEAAKRLRAPEAADPARAEPAAQPAPAAEAEAAKAAEKARAADAERASRIEAAAERLQAAKQAILEWQAREEQEAAQRLKALEEQDRADRAERERATNAERIRGDTCATWRSFYERERTDYNRSMMERSCRQ